MAGVSDLRKPRRSPRSGAEKGLYALSPPVKVQHRRKRIPAHAPGTKIDIRERRNPIQAKIGPVSEASGRSESLFRAESISASALWRASQFQTHRKLASAHASASWNRVFLRLTYRACPIPN